ncbi:coiled-coil domain-containing protein 43 [Chrysoperla carnea]|uniref:coiled-coil domain-containing protein 43 n=1 Tax=Chrysoperla carnea TaxID=189513 RepID=UPI001D0692D3|nr:coiled-coil domain-containing protein 43 [Chrysoperla carnea]
MAAAVDGFSAWLGHKLQALNTDENVFGSYITAILEGDETIEEKVEGLDGILSEIINNDTSVLSKEILDMWNKYHPVEENDSNQSQIDVDEKLVRLLESQSLATTVQRSYTEEEKKIREAILAQYSQMSDEENEEDEFASTGGDSRENGLEKNTNALAVHLAEKEKREQAKMESQKKKDKDKEDREKQKQLKEERKEKRKTQKGERRR